MLELFCGKAELSKQCRPLSHSRNILIYGPYAKFINHNAEFLAAIASEDWLTLNVTAMIGLSTTCMT